MTLEARFNRLRLALAAEGLAQAVLSHPETLAQLGCFESPVEDWPVSNPFVAVPALLCLGPDEAVLVVADFHAADVRSSDAQVIAYRSYDFRSPPDPAGELRAALSRCPGRCRHRARPDRRRGAEPPARDRRVASRGRADAGRLRRRSRARRPISLRSVAPAGSRMSCSRRSRTTPRPVSARPSSRASPLQRCTREAGRRVPAILTVTTGAAATATGGGVATGRVVRSGDLVLTDTSPWIDGAWSDTANAVFVGDA